MTDFKVLYFLFFIHFSSIDSLNKGLKFSIFSVNNYH